MASNKYLKLTDKEIGLYTQHMYDYSGISQDLFFEIFYNKYDWGLFDFNLEDDKDDNANGIPKSSQIICNVDTSYKNIDTITWILNMEEQSILLEEMKGQDISEERQKEYIKSFPYISAIVIVFKPDYYDQINTKGEYYSYEKYGFYPYKGEILEKF